MNHSGKKNFISLFSGKIPGKQEITQMISAVIFFILFIIMNSPAALADCDCTNTLVTGVPQIECEALVAFYNNTGESGWKYIENWNTDSNVTTWEGVTVENGHVSGIELIDTFNLDLSGSIPPEIGNLSHLKLFTLKGFGNKINGIAPEIGKLSNLEVLHFSNLINGSIPPELGNLSNLKVLDLFGNYLTGSIPPELGKLSNLKTLDLSSTQLTGSIPPELGNLSSLEHLDFFGIKLTGSIPPELGNLSNLKTLDFSSTKLTGSIPPELGNLSSLTSLNFYYNEFSGSIPPELGNLSSLKYFKLDDNKLSGNIPPELGNLSSLIYLDLRNNQLSGNIPPELGNLSSLQVIDFSSNQLFGSIPPELGNLSKLENLYLSTNQLSGSIPPEIGNLSSLTSLNFTSNQLSGSIPPEMGNLSKLENLYLFTNELSGSIPPEIGNLSSLTSLDFTSNQLSGSIPPELGNLSCLHYLNLHNNQLTGTIPPKLGNLSSLICLGLSSNKLTGSIPPELGNLSSLTSLGLSSNKLTGSIPPEIGNLSNLLYFFLNNNELTGSIPPEIRNLSSLWYLSFANNQLSGNIPVELKNLANLQQLDISYNFFSTDVPDVDLKEILDTLDPDWAETQQSTGDLPAYAFFPHIASGTGGWETEICLINIRDQIMNGKLKAYAKNGSLIDEKNISIPSGNRREMTIGEEFASPDQIGQLVFEADESNNTEWCGYTKFFISGKNRVAVLARTAPVEGDIYIPHIASNAVWWTGISLQNTTASVKALVMEFNTGDKKNITLEPQESRAFFVRDLFDGQTPEGIESAIIRSAQGITGIELFGTNEGSNWNYLSGITLTDKKSTEIFFPHIAVNSEWWTGIVVFNPLYRSNTVEIIPYSKDGEELSPSRSETITPCKKTVYMVGDMELPPSTEWIQIRAKYPVTGFELFGTNNGNQLGGYTAVGIGKKEGIFPKLEKDGWTGIAFVNIEDTTANITLTAYDDSGNIIGSPVSMQLSSHAKYVAFAEKFFVHDISQATYIKYESDRNLAGFQLNGSSDGMMLDGLPGL